MVYIRYDNGAIIFFTRIWFFIKLFYSYFISHRHEKNIHVKEDVIGFENFMYMYEGLCLKIKIRMICFYIQEIVLCVRGLF